MVDRTDRERAFWTLEGGTIYKFSILSKLVDKY